MRHPPILPGEAASPHVAFQCVVRNRRCAVRWPKRFGTMILLVILLALMLVLVARHVYAAETRRFVARIIGMDADGLIWMEPVIKPRFAFNEESGALRLKYKGEVVGEAKRGTTVICDFRLEKRVALDPETKEPITMAHLILQCDDGLRYTLAGIALD